MTARIGRWTMAIRARHAGHSTWTSHRQTVDATPRIPRRKNVSGIPGATRMTPSEAFVETLVANGVTDVFGIVGSAYMDALDIFPAAGIRFMPVAHEQGAAHMADGYARVSGRHGVCIAQNGPGITNFVTAIAAAYWAHRPVVFITPETGSMTHGPGRLPGDRAAADLLEDHQVPGAREQSRAHGRDRRALLRPRDARDGPGAAQHPARLLLRRHRVRDPAPHPHRARRRAAKARSTRPPRCSPRRSSR